MKMKGHDRYFAFSKEKNSEDSYERLSVLYLPFIGTNAMSVYQLLCAESAHQNQYMELERLCTLTTLNINEISQAILVLEQYLLLKTYCSQQDDKYIFEIQQPLSFDKFLNHDLFGRAYLKLVGSKQYNIALERYIPKLSKEDFTEITAPFNMELLNQWNNDDELLFNQNKGQKSYTDQSIPIHFDYDIFLKNASYLVFPAVLRTEENLRRIGEMATIFSVDEENMYRLVGKSIDPKSQQLDFELLRSKCVNSKSVCVRTSSSPYDKMPVSFLYELQGNIPVSAADKKLLASLMEDYHLKAEVVNVLVEYVLKNNENKLSRGYVEKVAATWAREHVDSREEALKKASQPVKNFSSYKSKPSFSLETETKTKENNMDDIYSKMFGKD